MSFTTDFTYVINGLEVQCTDATVATPPPNFWLWHVSLGGPDPSSDIIINTQNTVIILPSPGTYNIDFYSHNGVESGSITKSVTVYGVFFTADYENENDTLNISFTDLSTPTPSSWAWDFGDGGTSTEQNPTHRYSTSGTYTVVLTVDSHTYTHSIVVASPQSIVLALANDGHIFKSEDDGQSWEDQGLKVSPYDSASHGLDVSCGLVNFGGGILIAYTGHDYIERSTDFGETWSKVSIPYFVDHSHVARAGVSLGMGRGLLAGFRFNPTCNDMLLGSILITLDYGLTWSLTTNINNYGTYLGFSSFAGKRYITALRATLVGACGETSDSKTQIAVSKNCGGQWATISEAISYSLDTPNNLITTMLPDGKTVIPRTRTSLRAYDFVAQLFSVIDPNKVFDRIYWSKSGKLFASSGEYEDVMTFTPRTTADVPFYSVAYGNGIFVAVGVGSTVMTSVNGISWTWGSVLPSATWWNVVFGNGMFVATSSLGMYASPDGVVWLSVFSDFEVKLGNITYGGGLFVAHDGGVVVTSSDGLTWNYGPGGGPGIPANYSLGKITYGGGKYVSVGYDDIGGVRAPLTSSNGYDWYAFTFPKDMGTCITYGNGLFVVLGSSGGLSTDVKIIMTSPDGENWTLRESPETNMYNGVFYGNGLFVGLAEFKTHSIITSIDGVKWTIRSDTRSTTKWSGAYGAGLYVIVNTSGGTNAKVITSPGPVIVSDPVPTLYRSSDRGDSFDNILENYETWAFYENTFGGSVITADFIGSPLSGTSPLSVQFTDLSTGSVPTSWLWDFGDDSTSTLQNPTHIYRRSGYYTVTLTVSDGVSSDSKTKVEYIHVDLIGTAVKPGYVRVNPTLKTWDLAPPKEIIGMNIAIARGTAQYTTSKKGVQVRMQVNTNNSFGSGFKRNSGPTLIFD